MDLSKGVPKDPALNLLWRDEVNRKASGSAALRADCRAVCKLDPLFYVNTFVWQYNPKHGGSEVGPFVTWDFQDAAILTLLDCIERGRDAIIEKSREMGASWLCLIVMEYLWHFHPWKKFLCVSKNADAVDKEDPDSLFWKLDFIHRYTPGWLMPESARKKFIFQNLSNGSSITGVAATGDAGVGGRATAMFCDEYSIFPADTDLMAHSTEVADCRIFNGTHRGVGTEFYNLTKRPSIERIVMHWTQHPEKRRGLYRSTGRGVGFEVLDHDYGYPPDFHFVTSGHPSGGPHPGLRSPWYDGACERKGTAWAVAMDLDMDPQGSTHQFFDALEINQLISSHAREPEWVGDLEYDRDSGLPSRLTADANGRIKLWVNPTGDGKVPKAPYAFGADISLGTGATPTCLSGVNGATGQKVFEYADPFIGAEEFAAFAVAVCRLFADEDGEGALLCWEADGPGLKTGQTIIGLGYRRVYYRVDEFKDKLRGKFKAVQSDRPGWTPSPKTKKVLLLDYKHALKNRKFVNRSEEALRQCLMFEYDSRGAVVHGQEASPRDPSGARVNHGDLVIADALACKMMGALERAEPKGEEEEVKPSSLAWRMRRVQNERAELLEDWND